jgi:hypothetical protein
MKRLLLNVLWVAVVVAAVILGNQLPALQRMDDYCRVHRQPLMIAALSLLIPGFVCFMGTAIYFSLRGGRTLSTADHVQTVGGSFSAPGRFAIWRFRGRIAAKGFEDEASISEMKNAAGGWWGDSRWRRDYLMGIFAAIMGLGLFFLVGVLAPAGIKLLIGAAVLYAAVRLVWAFAKA